MFNKQRQFDIYKISENERVCVSIEKLKFEDLNEYRDFQPMNKAALAADIFTPSLFEKAEDLRKKRNKIHLAGLDPTTETYLNKSGVESLFKDAKLILERIEKVVSQA